MRNPGEPGRERTECAACFGIDQGEEHETSLVAGSRRARRRPAGRAGRERAGLPVATDHPDRAVAGGRRGRCDLSRRRAAPVGAAGQVGGGREPAGRRLGDRDRRRRQGLARRLHHGHGRQRIARHQRHHVQEAALRSGQGFHPDRTRRQDSLRARGHSVAAGAFGGGAGDLRQGQSRQAVVRIGRARLPASSLRRAAQEHDRHRDDPRALQGQRAGADRRDRRPRAAPVLRHRPLAAADPGRQGAGARGIDRGPRSVGARHPDDRRSRRPRLRRRRLGRVRGAGRHAARRSSASSRPRFTPSWRCPTCSSRSSSSA